jgi:hypothetical protein
LRASERAQLALLCLALLPARLASALVVSQPGYTDAYYYSVVAERLAAGQGLTADFVWNFLEAPGFAELPVASHRFWMPLATVLQAAGIAVLGPLLGAFRAGQAAIILLAALIPAAAYLSARALGASHRAALVAGALAGAGGAFAPSWVSADAFVPAALAGSAVFLTYGRAAAGDVRAALAAGLAVGILFLARAEGALFGLALLALPGPARIVGAGAALAIGLGWEARRASLGFPADLLARSAFLVRYEDFFALRPPTLDAYLAAWPSALASKATALVGNALTFIFAFALLLVPAIARGVRELWRRPDVRAFAVLALVIYLAQSLVWTLHSVRGSYFHSLAAFFPFGVALGVRGSGWLMRRETVRRVVPAATLAAMAVLSAFALGEWDAAFNTPYRARVAQLGQIEGPIVAVDAAAWRWISGDSALVTPADEMAAAFCVMGRYAARTIVLEPSHFSVYEALFRGTAEAPAGVQRIGGGPAVLYVAEGGASESCVRPP